MSSEFDLDLSASEEERADRLHEESIVVDGLLPGTVYFEEEGYKDHLARGGITAGNFTIATKDDFIPAVQKIQQIYDLMEENPDKTIVTTVEEIRQAKEDGKVGVIIGFQSAQPIQTDLGFVRAFYQMGTRIIQLTYNSTNYLGGGCWENGDGGLTHFGEDVIDLMNEYGILVDLSHCNDQTSMDAIEYSDDPVAFTHVGARAVGNAYGRGKTDEQMQAIVEKGGIVGITFHPPFVKMDPDTHAVLPSTLDDVLDHIDHAVDLVGAEHVTFGSDMNDHSYDQKDRGEYEATFDERHMTLRAASSHVFGSTPPEEVDAVQGVHRTTEFKNLTRGLVSRGYTDDEIRGILGENFLDVCETVWGT